MTFTQLFHQSESESCSPLHVAARHETFHMLLSNCVCQMRNVCTDLLKSCYTYVVIKTFEKCWFSSLLTDSFLSILFIISCNQISELKNRDEICCCVQNQSTWATSSRDSRLMALRANSLSTWPPFSNYHGLGRSIPDLFSPLPHSARMCHYSCVSFH